MIVAATAPQLFVVLANSRADDPGLTKIERRALDRARWPRQRDRAVVDGTLYLPARDSSQEFAEISRGPANTSRTVTASAVSANTVTAPAAKARASRGSLRT